MAETEKPNWGNRIILLIFGALAVITIGATIIATINEWGEGNVAGSTAVEDRTGLRARRRNARRDSGRPIAMLCQATSADGTASAMNPPPRTCASALSSE